MIDVVLKAARDRDAEDYRNRVTQAWLTAGLGQMTGKNFPELASLIDETPQRQGQSDDEMAHNLALWGAVIKHQFGNAEHEKEG